MNNNPQQSNQDIPEYYMNPFDFVPLPPEGPREIPEAVLQEPRYEGILTYSIKLLTPVHISGKISTEGQGDNLRYKKKFFFRRQKSGNCIIPGSSVRGMLAGFIEALTGSDFGTLTRGDEGKGDPTQYEKYYGGDSKKKNNRHVGFLMQAEDHPDTNNTDTSKYERYATLPNAFGQKKREDIARYLFGYVREDEEDVAWKGRLIFEDINLDASVQMVDQPTWDVKGAASMGSPNPRANTAWYFTSSQARKRNVKITLPDGRSFDTWVWEMLADKVRGRKFYFHQDPELCFNYYQKYWKRQENRNDRSTTSEGWMPLVQYSAESIAPGQTIRGKLYFKDLPLAMLHLLKFSLELPNDKLLAHKLGGGKPFGFGSVQFIVDSIQYRAMNDVFSDMNSLTDSIKISNLPEAIIDQTAWNWLRRILRLPDDWQSDSFLFIYPPYRQMKQKIPWKKGFAQPESVDPKHPNRPPSPGNSLKKTLFFDWYQQNAKNFESVFGNDFDYRHSR